MHSKRYDEMKTVQLHVAQKRPLSSPMKVALVLGPTSTNNQECFADKSILVGMSEC